MFLSTDSDRDEPPSMLCKSASRDGSIPSGIDLFNSDLAGMPLSLLCYSLLYIFNTFVITLQLYLIIYQSMTTIVSLLLFIILFSSIIVMYLHHYLHQVFKCIFIEHGNII